MQAARDIRGIEPTRMCLGSGTGEDDFDVLPYWEQAETHGAAMRHGARSMTPQTCNNPDHSETDG
jgi:hypothetical protein